MFLNKSLSVNIAIILESIDLIVYGHWSIETDMSSFIFARRITYLKPVAAIPGYLTEKTLA